MNIHIIGECNLGSDPVLKFVPVKKNGEQEERAVLELSGRFDVKKINSEGERQDVKGFWASMSLWGKRAELFRPFLKKGVRTLIVGSMEMGQYVAQRGEREGEHIDVVEIDIQSIGIIPMGMESITFKTKEQSDQAPAKSSSSANAKQKDKA